MKIKLLSFQLLYIYIYKLSSMWIVVFLFITANWRSVSHWLTQLGKCYHWKWNSYWDHCPSIFAFSASFWRKRCQVDWSELPATQTRQLVPYRSAFAGHISTCFILLKCTTFGIKSIFPDSPIYPTSLRTFYDHALEFWIIPNPLFDIFCHFGGFP